MKPKKFYKKIRAGILYFKYKLLKSSKTFKFKDKEYKYLIHRYNRAWNNERTIEVPIIMEEVLLHADKNILEVGNVLQHYFYINYDVIDKYEKGNGVINEDVCTFNSKKKYDLIVSISTIEHVGWDKENDPDKIPRAIENLKKLLSKDGQIIITVPIDYNSYLDDLIKNNKLEFTKIYCMKRITKDNQWIETNLEDIKDIKYGSPFNNANAIIIGMIKNENKEK